MAVNAGLVLLVSLVVIVTILVIVLSVWGYSANLADQKQSVSGITGLSPCIQTVNLDTLVDIPPDTPRCFNRNYYCINALSNGVYDYIVTTSANTPQDVCVQFCSQYSNGTCTGPDYSGKSAQDNFDNCIAQLTPTDCVPPLPIAKMGTTLFYAAIPTCQTCTTS